MPFSMFFLIVFDVQKSAQRHQRCPSVFGFLEPLLNFFLLDFGPFLVPRMVPKSTKNQSQDRFLFESDFGPDLEAVLDRLLKNFGFPESPVIEEKQIAFEHVWVCLFIRCCDRVWIDF